MDSKLMQYLQTYEKALEMGFRTNLILGPKLYGESERELLVSMMKKYPNSLTVKILPYRPRHQMIQIGNNYESYVPHEVDQEIIKSIGLTKPRPDVKAKLDWEKECHESMAKEATIDDIEKMKLYSF